MKILALDSSSVPVSVAISEDGRLLASFFVNIKTTHSQTLMPILDAVKNVANISIKEIDLVAVTHGPGSFTGVRIAINVAKALSFAMNIPCVGISTLESLVYNLQGNNCIAASVMDARRNQVYNAIFEINGNKVTRLTEDRAISIENLLEELRSRYSNISRNIIFIGDGAELCYKLKNVKDVNFEIAPNNLRLQHAVSVATIASQIKKSQYLTSAKLVPNYLRLSQAERELKQKHKK